MVRTYSVLMVYLRVCWTLSGPALSLSLCVRVCVCVQRESLTDFLSEASPTPDSFTSPISPPSPPWQPVSSCEYLCAFVHFFKAHLVAKARLLSPSAYLLVSPSHPLCRRILQPKLPAFFLSQTFTSFKPTSEASGPVHSYLVCAGKSLIT